MKFYSNKNSEGKIFNMGIFQQLSKNKNLEIELEYEPKPWSLFNFNCHYTIRGDHAGFRLEISLWKFGICIDIYDSRHWDWKNDQWQKYDKEGYPIDETGKRIYED